MNFLRLKAEVNLRDFAWILQMRCSTLPYRTSVAASTHEDLMAKISDLVDEGNADVALNIRYFNKTKPRILGVFTGKQRLQIRYEDIIDLKITQVRGLVGNEWVQN